MSNPKVYFCIETALEEVPREEWPTSPKVSRALLKCPRMRGIVRQHILKRGVDLSYIDDIVSEVAVVLQMKMFAGILDVPKSVYYVIFRVSQLVVSNYGKKSINTSHSEEVSLSSFLQPGDDEQDTLERLSSESAVDDLADIGEKKIDLDNAQRRLTEKLAIQGWPEEIQKERTRLGRPRKLQGNPT